MIVKCWVILVSVIGTCLTARLDNTYLPPGNAGSAGGAGLIPTPLRPGGGGGIKGPGVRPGGGSAGAGGGGGFPGSSGGFPGSSGTFPGSSGGFPASSGGFPGSSGGFPGSSGGGGGGGGGAGGRGSGGQDIPIVSFSSENNGDGSYAFSYETGNGITAQETGQSQGDAEAVSGSYSYTGPDGVQYSITYTADAEGFHPQGAHIPTPPPIPPEIQRGIELSLAAEARGENQDDGSGGRGGSGGGGSGGARPGGQGGFTGGQGFSGGQGGFKGYGGGSGSGGSAYQGPNSYQGSSGGYQY